MIAVVHDTRGAEVSPGRRGGREAERKPKVEEEGLGSKEAAAPFTAFLHRSSTCHQ